MTTTTALEINPQVNAIITQKYAADTSGYQQLQNARTQAEAIRACRSYLDTLAGEVVECCAVIFPSAQLKSGLGRSQTSKDVTIQISHPKPVSPDLHTKIVPISDRADANFYYLDPLLRKVVHLKVTPNSDKVARIEEPFPPFQENRLNGIEGSWNDSIVLVQNGSFYIQPITQPAPSEPQPKPDVSDVKG